MREITDPNLIADLDADYGRGNIDLNNRPVIKNPDGSISTVNSITIGEDGKYVLIPGVNEERKLTAREAIDQYKKTGRHLGKFNTQQEADEYGQQLHESQAKKYLPKYEKEVTDPSLIASLEGKREVTKKDDTIMGIPTDPMWGYNLMKSLSMGAGQGIIESADLLAKITGLPRVGEVPKEFSVGNAPMPGVAAASAFITPLMIPGEKGIRAASLLSKATKSAIAKSAIGPKMYGEKILQGLSGGKDYAQNNEDVAQMVEDAYKARKNEANTLYDLALKGSKNDQVNANLFDSLSSRVKNRIEENSDLSDIYDIYKNDPSLENLHNVRKQVSDEVGYLNKQQDLGTLDQSGRNSLKDLIKIKEALDKDIRGALALKDENAYKLYDMANKYYAENVGPYSSIKAIRKMAVGKDEDPRNVLNIFKNPTADVKKIVEDMGPYAKKKILFSYLSRSKNPEQLAENMNKTNLQIKGLDHYIDDSVEPQLNSLRKRILLKKITPWAGLGVIGMAGMLKSKAENLLTGE